MLANESFICDSLSMDRKGQFVTIAETVWSPTQVTAARVKIGNGCTLTHEFYEGAPCDWSKGHGATHTLWLGDKPGAGTRAAKLFKTCAMVVSDEDDNGNPVWEKWEFTGIEYVTSYDERSRIRIADCATWEPIRFYRKNGQLVSKREVVGVE